MMAMWNQSQGKAIDIAIEFGSEARGKGEAAAQAAARVSPEALLARFI